MALRRLWQELVTSKPLVCARRAEPSLPEPVLDGSAAVGVAVLGNDWVNHLLLVYWAQKGLRRRLLLVLLLSAPLSRIVLSSTRDLLSAQTGLAQSARATYFAGHTVITSIVHCL
jgi:hypothetical protein